MYSNRDIKKSLPAVAARLLSAKAGLLRDLVIGIIAVGIMILIYYFF